MLKKINKWLNDIIQASEIDRIKDLEVQNSALKDLVDIQSQIVEKQEKNLIVLREHIKKQDAIISRYKQTSALVYHNGGN